jgi:hypothetical protein
VIYCTCTAQCDSERGILSYSVFMCFVNGFENKQRLFLYTTLNEWFLGAFVKLRILTISCVTSVRLSAWNNSATTGRFFMKFGIRIFLKSLERNQVSLKSDHKNQYFTRRPIHIFDHISLNFSTNEKRFRQKL